MTTSPTLQLNDSHAIPQLGMGVWQVNPEDVISSLKYGLNVGYRHIDTAAIYKNEEGVGQAIRESKIKREDIFLTTKLWNDRHQDAVAACKESLSRLGTDYVDLYLIHWPSPINGSRYLEAWESLITLRDQGLVRSIGVSNFTVEDLTRLTTHSDVIPAVNQIELHPTFAQTQLRAKHAELGIHTQAWSPLGQAKELANPTIIDIAQRHNITPAQVILAWHLSHEIIVFPKSVTPARIEENFGALEVKLSTEDLALIDTLDEGNRIGPDPALADF
ncbi:MAG: aldo/keto reductase [Propionibacteriaceae bacterium]